MSTGDVEAFCLFVGYTRSGHSLVGSLLDAHPEAVIAHEGKMFQYVRGPEPLRRATAGQAELRPALQRELELSAQGYRGFTGQLLPRDRDGLVRYLCHRSEVKAQEGRLGSRLVDGVPSRASYLVPGAWQGRVRRLRILGNKAGQEPPLVWQINPAIFDELEALVRAPVRLVHVYRNPWDNIASMARNAGPKAASRYFKRAEIIAEIKATGRRPMLDVCLEDLIARPEAEITRLFEWFGLEAEPGLVAACAGIVDGEPNPSRVTHEWTEREVADVVRGVRRVPWLGRYPESPRP